MECASNILTGADPDMMVQAVYIALQFPREWSPPQEYVKPHVSTTVAKIVLGYYSQQHQ